PGGRSRRRVLRGGPLRSGAGRAARNHRGSGLRIRSRHGGFGCPAGRGDPGRDRAGGGSVGLTGLADGGEMRNAGPIVTRRATKLQAALADPGDSGDSGPLRALRLGVSTFMAEERIDMSAMARELEINRATLYRWVGS